MGRFTRAIAAVVASAIVLAAAGSALGAGSGKGRKSTGTVYLATTHLGKGFVWAAGNTFDKVLGNGAVSYKVKVSAGSGAGTFQFSVRRAHVFTATGSFVGKVTATQTIDKNGNATISNGRFSFTKGFGSLKGHSYKGTFTGSGSAVTGRYTIQTKGIYK